MSARLRRREVIHGTNAMYGRGCRCRKCKAAKSAKDRDYRERKADPAGFKPKKSGPAEAPARALCESLGITYRQLDYWCVSGYVPGVEHDPGTGNWRSFTPQQVGRLAALAEASRILAMKLPDLADWIAASAEEKSA